MNVRIALLAIPLIAFAAGADAGTTEELYSRKLEKRTISFNDSATWTKPKTMCICTESSGNDRRVGALTLTTLSPLTAACGIILFNGSGEPNGLVLCDDYVILGK